MTDQQWDKKLKINTTGREDAHADNYHFPYEPTPYSVLERLASSGYINKNSTLIDYGCGKGRVSFFLCKELGCHSIGIEYNQQIYQQAEENRKNYIRKQSVEFVCTNAEDFPITDADCFYFFNPFSVEILRSVLGQILDSYYGNPRTMQLFFYYPNDEYLSYLMTVPELLFVDEIACQDLFEGNNKRERILVFEI